MVLMEDVRLASSAGRGRPHSIKNELPEELQGGVNCGNHFGCGKESAQSTVWLRQNLDVARPSSPYKRKNCRDDEIYSDLQNRNSGVNRPSSNFVPPKLHAFNR